MELSTGVKPSWNWDLKDQSSLQWRRHKTSLLLCTVSLSRQHQPAEEHYQNVPTSQFLHFVTTQSNINRSASSGGIITSRYNQSPGRRTSTTELLGCSKPPPHVHLDVPVREKGSLPCRRSDYQLHHCVGWGEVHLFSGQPAGKCHQGV